MRITAEWLTSFCGIEFVDADLRWEIQTGPAGPMKISETNVVENGNKFAHPSHLLRVSLEWSTESVRDCPPDVVD